MLENLSSVLLEAPCQTLEDSVQTLVVFIGQAVLATIHLQAIQGSEFLAKFTALVQETFNTKKDTEELLETLT